MKIVVGKQCCWRKEYDWMIIPSIMFGARNRKTHKAFGLAFLFLKVKAEFQIYFFDLKPIQHETN